MPAAATVAPKSAPPVQRNTAPSSRTAGASAAGPKAASSSAARASALPSFARSSLTPLRAAGAGPTLSPRPKPASPSGSGSGQPMAPHIQEAIENSFEVDLSSVRLHTDAQAQESAQQLSARAFTHGSDIFLGPGERPTDLPLIAHEAAHVVQQQTGHAQQRLSADRGDRYEVEADRASAAVQRGESFTVEERVGPARVQRFGLSDALDWIADKANIIPGFRMFTIVLGVNPINMSRVDATAANVLRALLEIIPGGGLISQALESSGIFEKVGNWVAQQIKTLGMIGSAIKQALLDFIDSLGLSDLFHLGRVWDRAKRIFTEPIDRIINFVTGLVSDIVKFIKDAILQPLAKLAENTKAYPLLKAVLGHDPITGEPVPDDASAILGGLMTLAGQEEMWENIKKANAMARLAAWFKGAKNSLIAFVKQVPGLVISTIKSLELSDIIVLPRAITKVVKVFGGFVVDFISWVGNAVWNLLEIVFDVVSPGAWSYIKKTGAALKSILKNPLPFVRNLVRAAKLGFENFVGNILTHLKAGLIDWLTGSLPGVYIPKALTLGEVGQFAMSVLGITWAQIRGKIVKALGPNGETIMKGLETAFDVVVALVKGGVSAAWDLIKEKITNLKDMVIDGIQSFVIDTIVKKAIPKLVAMFIPGAGFISAIISIYDTIKVFIEKLAKMIAVVKSFVDSIVAIAAGQIEGAAKRVESALAGLLSLAISFLAGFIGLGNISSKIMGVIEKVRAAVDKALDTAIGWLVGKAKSLFAKLFGKDKDKDKKDLKPDERTPQQKQADLDKAVIETDAALAKESRRKKAEKKLAAIEKTYRLTKAELVVDEQKGGTTFFHAALEINPVAKSKTVGEKDYIDPAINLDPPFVCKESLNRQEFERQVAIQQAAMNAMNVSQWLKNLDKFADEGRSKVGSAKQARLRDLAYDQFFATVVNERSDFYQANYGMAKPIALSKATGFANRLLAYQAGTDGRRRFKNSQLTEDRAYGGAVIKNELYKQAALHTLDQVAGGSGEELEPELGGAREDFSIGAQWKGGRIVKLRKNVENEVKSVSKEDLENVEMRVKLGIQ
jgi:Domain of unknown function (DUF4157)/Novel toxin 15